MAWKAADVVEAPVGVPVLDQPGSGPLADAACGGIPLPAQWPCRFLFSTIPPLALGESPLATAAPKP
jgi:hypothetical protein